MRGRRLGDLPHAKKSRTTPPRRTRHRSRTIPLRRPRPASPSGTAVTRRTKQTTMMTMTMTIRRDCRLPSSYYLRSSATLALAQNRCDGGRPSPPRARAPSPPTTTPTNESPSPGTIISLRSRTRARSRRHHCWPTTTPPWTWTHGSTPRLRWRRAPCRGDRVGVIIQREPRPSCGRRERRREQEADP